MSSFRDYDRSQQLLLPRDLNDWMADDDLAHFIVEAVERVDMSAFHVSRTGSGKAQYHPRTKLKAKLDAAARRLEDAASDDHDGEGTPPPPRAEKQTNLTDPDSAIMRKSARHEYRQAYNAQAAADADGSMLVLAHDVLNTANDRAGLETLPDAMENGPGLPDTLLADAGYAGEEVVKRLENRSIAPLIAIAREQAKRPYDFRPPPARDTPPEAVTARWRRDMITRLQTDPAKAQYKKRKQTVEPVFGILKSVPGFTRFHLRGLEKVKAEWILVTLACNCRRITNLRAA